MRETDIHDTVARAKAFGTGLVIVTGILLSLSGCSGLASDIAALAQDPATGSLHANITYPGAQITIDYTRVNSTGTAAAAGASGTSVNVPTGSTVNPAPAKPAVGTTVSAVAPTAP